MKTPLWKAIGVSSGYQNHTILSDIGLEIFDSEILAVIGVNGAGKSSLLKLVLGLLPVTRGETFFRDRPMSTLPGQQRRHALSLLESHPFCTFPMKVRDLIHLSLSNGDKSAEEDAIDLTGVEGFLDKSVLQLSSGELKRAFVAHLLTQNTEVIMADEVFSNLDWAYKIRLVRGLKEWKQKYKRSFVIALHDLDLVEDLADRVVLVNQGKIVAVGLPSEVLNSPAFEASFGLPFSQFYTKR